VDLSNIFRTSEAILRLDFPKGRGRIGVLLRRPKMDILVMVVLKYDAINRDEHSC
jgi:hypothetical protein